MATTKKLMGTTAVGGAVAIEDVFSTYLYTGNGSTQTITNGIDLAGEGGMVWIKSRSSATDNQLFDTERGATNELISNSTAAQATDTDTLTAFNSDGLSIGADANTNTSAATYASWTFRKAPRFFDVVTYTGDGVAGRTVSHNLGSVPGCMIVKRTDAAGGWYVYHTSLGATKNLQLSSTLAALTRTQIWNDTAPTSTVFSLGTDTDVNASGGTYVAYLFAHDPLGPSGDGSDGLIACGSYAGNGATNGPEIDLGWEAQFVIIKRTNASDDWVMYDVMRGMPVGSDSAELNPNANYAENGYFGSSQPDIHPTATGFKLQGTSSPYNNGSSNYIYIAIRRGPMRQPTSGTEVFDVKSSTGPTGAVLTTGFPVDFQIATWDDPSFSGIDREAYTRLLGVSSSSSIGENYLVTNTTAAEVSLSSGDTRHTQDWNNTGFDYPAWYSGISTVFWSFRRAPGFFDVVAYTGDGVAGRTVSHNLGVAPEMIIHKCRNSSSRSWYVYAASLGVDYRLVLDSAGGAASGYGTLAWNNTTPTDTEITLGSWGNLNGSGDNFIAYLFASCPGVSKVFSVTKSSGSAASVNCGFTSGPRFVLLKLTAREGDWYVWDTARGIVAGDDPYLLLNSTAAEVTNTDYIDPTSNGFTIVDGGLANGDYIGLAIS